MLPPVRSLVQHRLRYVVDRDDRRLPALTEMCSEVLEASLAAWGEHLLEVAPAFRATYTRNTADPP